MARDVFLSYSQPDRECAFAIVKSLESRGIGVWIAPRDVAPGADWAAEIIDAISSTRLMLLVFSSTSNESPQVRREVERAVHKQLPVLPFRLEDVLPSKSLEYFLSAQHWMDAFPPPLEQHIDKLCGYLHAALGETAAHDIRQVPTQAPGASSVGPTPMVQAAEPAQLRLLEAELVRCIGPLAGHLVRRAAQGGSDLRTIIQRLALEIDDEAQRRAFLDTCRRIATGH